MNYSKIAPALALTVLISACSSHGALLQPPVAVSAGAHLATNPMLPEGLAAASARSKIRRAAGWGANPTLREYPVPTSNSQPDYITIGSDGNQWFTELNGNKIAKADGNGNITEYSVPTGNSGPWGIVAGKAGTPFAGQIWFTENTAGKIGMITTAGVFKEFTLPNTSANPVGITIGPDNNIWFVEWSTDNVVKMTPQGVFTKYPTPTVNALMATIVPGPDGKLWFTETNSGKIGSITTAGAIVEYSGAVKPHTITPGNDGRLWFGDQGNNTIGAITTQGVITEYPIPTAGSEPTGIAQDIDGALYFAERSANKVGRITTTGTITEFPVTAGSAPYSVASNNGTVWFTESLGNRLGRFVAPPAPHQEFTAAGLQDPLEETLATDGNVWFTDFNGNKVGKITQTGAITEYALPGYNSDPWGIAAGAAGSRLSGTIWFTEYYGNKIGKITTGGRITEFPIFTGTPQEITPGPDGNSLWFTSYGMPYVSKMLPNGTETDCYTGFLKEIHIIVGPDNNVWFVDYNSGTISKITNANAVNASTTCAITTYTIPGAQPWALAVGANGKIWYTDVPNNAVGYISTDGTLGPTFPIDAEPTTMVAASDGNIYVVERRANNEFAKITMTGQVTQYQVPALWPYGIVQGGDGRLWITEEAGFFETYPLP